MVIEGTWDEIAALADKLSGRRLRVVVLPDDWESDEDDWEDQDPPMTWEEWEKEGDELAARIAKVWPAGLTAVDAVAEQRR